MSERSRSRCPNFSVSEARGGEWLAVPPTLAGLCAARLAALPDDVREVLETIALLGAPMVTIVEAVASDATSVRPRLIAAEAASVIERDGQRVRFSHPLLA